MTWPRAERRKGERRKLQRLGWWRLRRDRRRGKDRRGGGLVSAPTPVGVMLIRKAADSVLG